MACPAHLLGQILTAFRCKTRKTFATSLERSGEWPYWWIYETDDGTGDIYRLENDQVEVVEELGDITEVEVIAAHHARR